jgi:hypothetical protein
MTRKERGVEVFFNMLAPNEDERLEASLLDCCLHELLPPNPLMENLPSEIIEKIGFYLWATSSLQHWLDAYAHCANFGGMRDYVTMNERLKKGRRGEVWATRISLDDPVTPDHCDSLADCLASMRKSFSQVRLACQSAVFGLQRELQLPWYSLGRAS